jgi:class 3 adenylate cyclase
MKRKIAAILAADAPAYPGLLAAHAAAALTQLEAARRVFADTVTSFDGRIFNAAGASVLAEFASSVEALRCALAVQQGLADRGAAVPAAQRLWFKIGLTIGDIVEHEGDLLGDGVNVAARLAQFADDGGVCASRALYEQVRGRVEISAVDLGLKQLKNMPEPVRAFALTAGSNGTALGPLDRPAPAASSAPRWALAGLAGLGLVAGLAAWQIGTQSASRDTQATAPSTPGPARSATTAVPIEPAPLARIPGAASSTGEFDRSQKSQRCAEVLERIQAGSASPADRETLAQRCL